MKPKTNSPKDSTVSEGARQSRRVALLGAAVFALAGTQSRQVWAAPMTPWGHTRPATSVAGRLLARAAEQSSIVLAQLTALEQSDLIVYITDLMGGPSRGPASYLSFLSRDTSARYLLVRIDHSRLSPIEQIAMLGHELQHALEIAASPEVRDGAGLAQLYRRIGWEGGMDRFESTAARDAGNEVRKELRRRES